jgi:hypothetical protein
MPCFSLSFAAVSRGVSAPRRRAMASFMAVMIASVMPTPAIRANFRVSASASGLLTFSGMMRF